MLRTLLRLDVYERMRERAQRLAVLKKSTVDSLQTLLGDEYAGLDEAAPHRRMLHGCSSSLLMRFGI